MIDHIQPPAQPSSANRPDEPHLENPAEFLTAHFQRWSPPPGRELPVANAALQVEAIGFTRCQGDWLGVVVTPWFIRLFLLNGGGRLWGDIPAGQRRYLELPGGVLQFTADDDPALGPCQYSPLIDPVSTVPDMATARRIARDAMATFSGVAVAAPPVEPAPAVSRRGFLRRLAGRR
ncbi:[NiFe]-hydrogenase assembly chaperone HybE [Dechloromonas denitrificans]|uniref:[NiFe]-hydrogenase assembly chaperone HybE n=1 Tax=Dechloromonas denitrificans TaxID=281362 RepID=UPI001CFA7562|nr:[NiFe]-hydrogenase assembly chaperone HybE [Dechloromonas denitrificans]UCV07764.1 [NiFe]-hydrogenase assembly chaperone HybE [Dechloromonas denitrificans]